MAKVNNQTKSGSVGPSTFMNSSRYGLLERVRAWPVNPNTPAQQTHRGLVAEVAKRWRTLTESERDGWHDLGAQLAGRLTGTQIYIKVNVTLRRCGLAELRDAPAVPILGRLTCTGLVAEKTPRLQLTQVCDPAGADRLILEACRPVSQGMRFVDHLFRQLLVVPSPGAQPTDLDFTAAYTERFGAPRLGTRVVVRLRPMKSGFKGEPLRCGTIVVV